MIFRNHFSLFLALAVVFLAGCTALINKAAFYPDRSFALPAEKLPAGVRHELIPTTDGERIELFIVAGRDSRRAVLYFHGNGGNIAQRVPELQQIAATTDATVIGVGYRGYGASTGRASEQGIYRDGEAALGYVKQSLGFPDEKIVLFGRSLGSTVAVHLGARHKVAGIILVTPLSSGREFIKAHGLSALAFVGNGAFDNLARGPALTAPVLVVHGTDDEVVPFRHGQALYASIKAPKQFVTIDHGHHNDLEFVNPAMFWSAIADFMKAPSK